MAPAADGVVALLPTADVVVPDLRGFGGSDKHPADPTTQYSADAQARSIIGLIEELRLDRPVVGGYDIGSLVAQALARQRPDLVRALVLAPPLPGIGERILTSAAQQEFWYLPFHRLPLADELIDGRPEAVRSYLRSFLTHWSGPEFVVTDDRVVAEPVPHPAERIAVPTMALWPDRDPLFPTGWSDRLGQFFADVRLQHVDSGHFPPLECPRKFAAAVAAAAATTPA